MFIQMFNNGTWLKPIEIASLEYNLFITMEAMHKISINKYSKGSIIEHHTKPYIKQAKFDVRPINPNQVPNLSEAPKLLSDMKKHDVRGIYDEKITTPKQAFTYDLFSSLEFEMSDSMTTSFKGVATLDTRNNHIYYMINYPKPAPTNSNNKDLNRTDKEFNYTTKKGNHALDMLKKFFKSNYYKNQNHFEDLSIKEQDKNQVRFANIMSNPHKFHHFMNSIENPSSNSQSKDDTDDNVDNLLF